VTWLFWGLDVRVQGFMRDYHAFFETDETRLVDALGDETVRLFAHSQNRRGVTYYEGVQCVLRDQRDHRCGVWQLLRVPAFRFTMTHRM
jgi:hypothetical protein